MNAYANRSLKKGGSGSNVQDRKICLSFLLSNGISAKCIELFGEGFAFAIKEIQGDLKRSEAGVTDPLKFHKIGTLLRADLGTADREIRIHHQPARPQRQTLGKGGLQIGELQQFGAK